MIMLTIISYAIEQIYLYWPKFFPVIQYQDDIIGLLKSLSKSIGRHSQGIHISFHSNNIRWFVHGKIPNDLSKFSSIQGESLK